MKINLEIHRFKYSDEFHCCIRDFASIHRHDSCKNFQEQWSEFIQREKTLFEKEALNMINSGYKGEPYVAMYKSARFYYRKLFINNTSDYGNKVKEDKPKRTYITFPHSLIDKVDAHIKQQISLQLKRVDDDTYTSSISPSNTLNLFCRKYDYDIKYAFENIISGIRAKNDNVNIEELNLSLKFKKMYKNRFYKIQEKLKN